MSTTQNNILRFALIFIKRFIKIIAKLLLCAVLNNIRKTDAGNKRRFVVIIFIIKFMEFFAFKRTLGCHYKRKAVGILVICRLNCNYRQRIFFPKISRSLGRSRIARNNYCLAAVIFNKKRNDFIAAFNNFIVTFIAVGAIGRIAEKHIVFIRQNGKTFYKHSASAYSRIKKADRGTIFHRF